MLVLSRKEKERIMIGEGITLTVLSVKGGTVRLGIEAPSDVSILRSEVAERDKAAVRQHSCDAIAGVATD